MNKEEEMQAIQKVMQVFEDKLGIKNYQDSSSLKDLGLDSLDVVEVLLEVEKMFDIKFTGEDRPETIKDLKNLILSKLAKK